MIENFKKFIDNSKHVLSVSTRPSPEEFNRSAKLIVFGILLIGFIGFIISVIVNFIITGTFSII